MDVFARDAERAFATGRTGHDHDAVTDVDFAGLGHHNDFAGGFMPVVFATIEPIFVLGTERDGMNFDQHPVLDGVGDGHIQ